MKKKAFFLIFIISAFAASAETGNWFCRDSISQTIIDGKVFYADDSSAALIKEIVFRTNKIVELYLQPDLTVPGDWYSAIYKVFDDYIEFSIQEFGTLTAFKKQILPGKLLISYLVSMENGTMTPIVTDSGEITGIGAPPDSKSMSEITGAGTILVFSSYFFLEK